MKKGQMEMMGLVIIVILITLGMLFLAQFALQDSGQKKIFTRKGLAYSTMSSLMKTTIPGSECGLQNNEPLSLGQQILDDCALYQQASSRYSCNNQHSCQFLEDFIKEKLLAPTLGQWHKTYEFRSTVLGLDGQPPELFSVNLNACQSAKERDSSGIFPIALEGVGIVENVLYICE